MTAENPMITASTAEATPRPSERQSGVSHSSLVNRVSYWREPQLCGGKRMNSSPEKESRTTMTVGTTMKTTTSANNPS
jgi:hypothetical protein